MWVISKRRLREFWELHADAREPLTAWYKITDGASWASLQDIRKTFPSADGVAIYCANIGVIPVTVFNVGGNKYRLVTRVDHMKYRVYVKFVLTHAQYSKDQWKTRVCSQ